MSEEAEEESSTQIPRAASVTDSNEDLTGKCADSEGDVVIRGNLMGSGDGNSAATSFSRTMGIRCRFPVTDDPNMPRPPSVVPIDASGLQQTEPSPHVATSKFRPSTEYYPDQDKLNYVTFNEDLVMPELEDLEPRGKCEPVVLSVRGYVDVENMLQLQTRLAVSDKKGTIKDPPASQAKVPPQDPVSTSSAGSRPKSMNGRNCREAMKTNKKQDCSYEEISIMKLVKIHELKVAELKASLNVANVVGTDQLNVQWVRVEQIAAESCDLSTLIQQRLSTLE